MELKNKDKVMGVLNQILETELAGVINYSHYSMMVFGYSRIPIVKWMKDQAAESMEHAYEAGELITHFGEHPSLGIGELTETHKHDIGDILREALYHERKALKYYYDLLELVKDEHVMLEEYARKMIEQEERHIGEVDKMLRKPGDVARFQG